MYKRQDGVCKYLGITQQSTTLFNDDSQLTIGKLEKEYSGQQMLQDVYKRQHLTMVLKNGLQ